MYVGFAVVLAFILGLLVRGGSGKWKRALKEEREAHARLQADHDARITAANARIADLERHVPPDPLAGGSIGAAASGKRDDLSLVRGIGTDGEMRLNGLGVHGYRDIERMSETEEAALEGRLGYEPGRIGREHWREQAALLRAGKLDEVRARYG